MQKLILFVSVVLFSTISFCQNNQDQNPETARKIRHILKVESRIPELPVGLDELNDQILPEIAIKRNELAPNMPNHDALYGQELLDTMGAWIESYSEEYYAYTAYLESICRSHRQ